MSPVADCNLAVYYNLAAGSLDKLSLLRGFYGCLANALQYLHNSKIRHRDIKPENILIKGSNVLLTDFGLSFDWEHLSRGTTTADLAKTPVYAAPEVAFFEPKKNSASDIWSLGCVFLEMVTVLKGESVSAMREFFKSRKDNYRYYDNLDSAKEWTKRLAKLGLEEDSVPVEWIANMLEVDPKERPTAATVYREILECEAKLRFCAPCCDHDETDETDTDGGSEDRDLWADTMQETVRGP
jgi:serine/threonine protein kinase